MVWGKAASNTREGTAPSACHSCWGFWAISVIGPYFFLKLNRLCDNSFNYKFLWGESDGIDVQHMWFQQDSATLHTTNETNRKYFLEILLLDGKCFHWKQWEGHHQCGRCHQVFQAMVPEDKKSWTHPEITRSSWSEHHEIRKSQHITD